MSAFRKRTFATIYSVFTQNAATSEPVSHYVWNKWMSDIWDGRLKTQFVKPKLHIISALMLQGLLSKSQFNPQVWKLAGWQAGVWLHSWAEGQSCVSGSPSISQVLKSEQNHSLKAWSYIGGEWKPQISNKVGLKHISGSHCQKGCCRIRKGAAKG